MDKNIYTTFIYIVIVVSIILSLYYSIQNINDIKRLFNMLTIVIFTSIFIVLLLMIKIKKFPNEFLQQINISEIGLKTIIFFRSFSFC